MKLIDAAVTHFSSRAIRTVEVPEWETTLYSKNLTLDDKAKWLARANSDTTDYMIYAVIFGLTDEKGDPVFTIDDKIKLRKSVDPEIIQRLANFILIPDPESEDDRKKSQQIMRGSQQSFTSCTSWRMNCVSLCQPFLR